MPTIEAPVETKSEEAKDKKAAKAKKPVAKATNGKAKASKKAAPKATERKPREKKEGLRKPQIRVLQALVKTKAPEGELTRKQISEQGKVDLAMLSEYIGKVEPDLRKTMEAKMGYPSLLTLGFVKIDQQEGEPTMYKITATGRKALEKALAE